MTARTGLMVMWASILTAMLVSLAAVFAAGAGAQTLSLAGKIVVIDPGHGGSDLGATYEFPSTSPYAKIGTLTEKHQNLDVAYKLRELLYREGAAAVYMTRGGDPSSPGAIKDPGDDFYADDANPSNTQRAEAANSVKVNGKGADILVSIHMNGSTNPDVDYTTTLFGKWRKDKEFAYAIFGDNVSPPKINPPTYGLRTLSALNGKGTSWGTIATRDPYSYASGVLLKSDMPATIAETVFLTNTKEAEQLAAGWTENPVQYDPNNGRQQQIAESLKTGVENYLATH